MDQQYLKKNPLPDQPGVYFFKKDREILYIGKATALKDRVRSYFVGDLGETRGPKLERMLELANKIEWQETDSVLEALLLESELIKKYQPKYNSREKDDKSYWYVVMTDEDYPRILSIRGHELESIKKSGQHHQNNFILRGWISQKFGPFPYGAEIKEALRIIRKIFPYRDKCLPCETSAKQGGRCRPCFNHQIGLCPGICTGEIAKADYRKIVHNIKLLFSGKKQQIIKNLEREMKNFAQKQEFEKASKTRDQIFALQHIRDVSLLKDKREKSGMRIEAYDIAHLSGKNTVGSMVVWQDSEMQRSEYKKFRLKGAKAKQPDDPANLREILERRFNHPEWPLPDIIVVDGNQIQTEVVREVVKNRIKIIAVTKDTKHKAAKLLGDSAIIRDYRRAIIETNAEAHRFALSYHRKLRRRLV